MTRRAIRSGRGRRGVVTLWTILALPLLFTILCAVAEVGHLWQARVQLDNALEAAALAAVQEWAEQGAAPQSIPAAETIGREYGLANTIQGRPLLLTPGTPQWRFGRATLRGRSYDFVPQPNDPQHPAVVLQASVKVPPLFQSSLYAWIGETTMSGQTAAYYDRTLNPPRARLIHLH